MPTYTLKSNSINSAANLFFVGDNGLANLVSGGAAVTTVGTINTSTFEGRTVYGDLASGVPTAQYLQSTVGAIAANQKFAVLLVGHTGYSAGDTDDYWGGPSFGGGSNPGTPPILRTYVPSWGNVTGPGIAGYVHPNTVLHTFIYGRESGNNIKHYANGTGAVALAANAYSGFAVASGTWKFGGTVTNSANAGFGVAIFAVFIGVSPTELADYIAANGTGTTEADKVYSALLDAGAAGVTGDSSITLGSITGTAAGTVSTAGSVTGSSAITLGAVGSSAIGTVTAFATFTSEPLKTNNGTLQASLALDWVRLYNVTTGALVVTKTGISTNSSGVFTVTDAALTVGQTYKADWRITTTGETRMPSKAAA